MANPKKRRKIIIFSVVGVVILALTALAILRKQEAVVTVQTEKVTRRNLTEIVVANGKVQPVVQVNISPEVSGEIIELPLKEGQQVRKGDLVLKIKPDVYIANRNQAEAAYKSSLAGKATAEANLRKAEADFKRSEELSRHQLVSESDFDAVKAAYDVAKAQVNSAEHQAEMAHASLASAEEELAKTKIVSPLTGTISKLNSEVGERVLGTVQNIGTEVMTIADLNEMETRVEIGEVDVVLIQPGQSAQLEVDAFKDRKFTGTVTEIANSAKGSGISGSSSGLSSSSQEATKFEVKIRLKEKEMFRPGMSVTAEIETRSRTNVLTVPTASVTTRIPKEKDKKDDSKSVKLKNTPKTNSMGAKAKGLAAATNAAATDGTNSARADKKREAAKPVEVVFVADGNRAKMVPVKIGISDDAYWEITEGLQEGQEVISGGYRAISRDLEDHKKIRRGPAEADKEKGESKN